MSTTAAVRTNIAISPEVPWDIAVHLQEIYRQLGNHTQAFSLIKQAANAAGNTVNNFAEVVNAGGGPTPTATGIAVNNQSGQTSYATVAGDNLTLIVFSDASPVAVSLTGQAPPWACFISNQGTGTTTLTPQTGTINYAGNPGAASLALPGGYSCIVAFDGTNWWADVDTGGDATSIRGVGVSATAPTDGQVLEYDSVSGLYVPASGMVNPMIDVGDLITGGAAGAPTRLPAGTAGYVLTSNGPGVAPSYQPGGGGGGGWTPTPPVAADFPTLRNSLTTPPTIADNAFGVGVEMTFLRNSTGASWQQAYYLKAAPGVPFRAEALISEPIQSTNNWFMMGISVGTDNASDVGRQLTVCNYMGGSMEFPFCKRNTSLTAQETAFTTVNAPSMLVTQQVTFWVAIEWDGTNINAYASFDGYTWWQAAVEPGTFFTGTPNLVGLGWEAVSSDAGIQYVWCPHFYVTTNLSEPFGLNRT